MRRHVLVKKSTVEVLKRLSIKYKLMKVDNKGERMFLKVLKKLRAKSSEVVHVGDNRLADFGIPSRVGIKSFLLIRSKKKKDKNAVTSLVDFERKLKNI
jgi:predicted HAD superfamily hydrolase